MLQKAKYIIMEITREDSPVVELVPVVFPISLTHKVMFKGAKLAYEDTDNLTNIKPYSAGFLQSRIKRSMESNSRPELKINTFGKSTSLNIESKEDDGDLILKMLRGERIINLIKL